MSEKNIASTERKKKRTLLRSTGAIVMAFSCLSLPAFSQPSGAVPDTTAFRFFFLHVISVEATADKLREAGKSDGRARAYFRMRIGLTNREEELLKRLARQCNASYAAESHGGAAIIAALKQQYPDPSQAPAETVEQVANLEAQRTRVITTCMQELQEGMKITSPVYHGGDRYSRYHMLYDWVMQFEAPAIKVGHSAPVVK